MASRFLIMLAADARIVFGDPDIPSVRRRAAHKRFKNRLLRLGEPIPERAGVANRRVCWEHDWPEVWPSTAGRDMVFEVDDEPGGDVVEITVSMALLDALPANWRYPLPAV